MPHLPSPLRQCSCHCSIVSTFIRGRLFCFVLFVRRNRFQALLLIHVHQVASRVLFSHIYGYYFRYYLFSYFLCIYYNCIFFVVYSFMWICISIMYSSTLFFIRVGFLSCLHYTPSFLFSHLRSFYLLPCPHFSPITTPNFPSLSRPHSSLPPTPSFPSRPSPANSISTVSRICFIFG